jgi:hypothetical protein
MPMTTAGGRRGIRILDGATLERICVRMPNVSLMGKLRARVGRWIPWPFGDGMGWFEPSRNRPEIVTPAGPVFKYGRRDKVHKTTGDYRFQGRVAMRGTKLDDKTIRYVVESDDGIMLIMNEAQLKPGWPGDVPRFDDGGVR